MGRLLNELSPIFRPHADALLARLVEARIMVLITCTGRTQAEQDAAFLAGTSRVRHSRHQDGFAIDLVPFNVYMLNGPDKVTWDTRDPVWVRIGDVGRVDPVLRWGGTFQPLNEISVGWDPGHFEIPV